MLAFRFPMALLLLTASFVASQLLAAPPNKTSSPPPDQAQPAPEAPASPSKEPPLALERFRPQSMLKVREHLLTQAKFPVVDVHTHMKFRLYHSPEQLDDFVKVMDRNNIAICVSLDGGLGEELEEHKKFLWTNYPDRFVIFATLPWQGAGKTNDPATWDMHRPDFARRMVRLLTEAKKQGASGLKVHKTLGLVFRNPNGTLVEVDDPRWDPIWEACGKLGLPVLIHTADPAAFFLPIDEKNERWEELSRHPEWSFYRADGQFPTRDELLAARNRVIARNPDTTFIGAHVAETSEDLAVAEQWLQRYPNLYLDPASRISELGRQPFTSRDFLIKYADRILFGTDGPWPEARIRLYWRFFETHDEYFPYSEKAFPPQGLWNIYGVGLPDETLQKIYYENAVRLVPGVKEKLTTYNERNPKP